MLPSRRPECGYTTHCGSAQTLRAEGTRQDADDHGPGLLSARVERWPWEGGLSVAVRCPGHPQKLPFPWGK